MLINLLESKEVLLEINIEKTKSQMQTKLVQRLATDDSFWRAREEELGEELDPLLSDETGAVYPWDEDTPENAAIRDKVFEYAYNKILKMDPTDGRADRPNVYSLWLIQRYASRGINSWEDLGNCRDLLTQYDRLKVTKTFDKMVRDNTISTNTKNLYNDINRIRTAAELYDVVATASRWIKRNTDEDKRAEFNQYIAEADAGGLEILWPSRDDFGSFNKYGMVIKLLTHETSRKLFNASTAWCTARDSDTYFNSYSRSSPLIVVINSQGDTVYQFHKKNHEAMQSNNSAIRGKALEIPLPLLQVVADHITDGNLSQLFFFMQVPENVQTAIHMMADVISKTDTPGVTLFETIVEKGVMAFPLGVLKQIVPMYISDTGQLPSAMNVIIAADVSDIGYSDTQAAVLTLLSTYLYNTRISPDPRSAADILDFVIRTRNLTSQYFLYVGTPQWGRVRNNLYSIFTSSAKAVRDTFISNNPTFFWMAQRGAVRNHISSISSACHRPDMTYQDYQNVWWNLNPSVAEFRELIHDHIEDFHSSSDHELLIKEFNTLVDRFGQLTSSQGVEGTGLLSEEIDFFIQTLKSMVPYYSPHRHNPLRGWVSSLIVKKNQSYNDRIGGFEHVNVGDFIRASQASAVEELKNILNNPHYTDQITPDLLVSLFDDNPPDFVHIIDQATLHIINGFSEQAKDELIGRIKAVAMRFCELTPQDTAVMLNSVVISTSLNLNDLAKIRNWILSDTSGQTIYMMTYRFLYLFNGTLRRITDDVLFPFAVDAVIRAVKRQLRINRFSNTFNEVMNLLEKMPMKTPQDERAMVDALVRYKEYATLALLTNAYGLEYGLSVIQSLTPEITGPDVWQELVDLRLVSGVA